MGVYEGLQEFKRDNSLIEVVDLDREGIVLLSQEADKKYHVRINCELSPELRPNVFVHEALHFSKEFISYLGQRLGEDHPVERRIDEITAEVNRCQPRLMGYLERKLKQEYRKDYGLQDLREYLHAIKTKKP